MSIKSKIKHIGRFLNRMVGSCNDFESDRFKKLWVPIKEANNKNYSYTQHVISHCLDGVIFAALINIAEPGFVDLRVLNMPPNIDDPIPLTKDEIEQNLTTVFQTISALDINFEWKLTVERFMNPKNTINMIIGITHKLFQLILSNKVNLKTHPELIRLVKTDKAKLESKQYNWSQWYPLWKQFLVENTKVKPLSTTDTDTKNDDDSKNNDSNEASFNVFKDWLPDLKWVLSCLIKGFDTNSNDAGTIHDSITNLGITNTIVLKEDIEVNNCFLVELLICDVFHNKNLIQKIKDDEALNLKKLLKGNNERALQAWMNSILPKKMRIKNLDGDLSDGIAILKVLDLCKPGCVIWKNNIKKKCKNRFEKLGNCNHAIDVAKTKGFGFTMIGFGGSDIVDGHQKTIFSLLWQMKRYYATKLLRDLAFNGKNVTNDDILKWTNKKIISFNSIIEDNNDLKAYKRKPLKSFKEKSNLNDCVIYCNLLASINMEWINYKLVYGSKQNGIKNAGYVITIIRKLGQGIFVNPRELASADIHAVLTVVACIMTIDANFNKKIKNAST